MLHVLLLLLKILGILLLLLIGLFLLLLLTPIHYSFEFEKEEQTEPKFVVRVTWLFWLFYFKTSYIEKIFEYQVRILGCQIAGNQPGFLKKQEERQRRKAEKAKVQKERKERKEHRKKKQEEQSEKTKGTGGSLPVTVTEKKHSVLEEASQEDVFQADILKNPPSESQIDNSVQDQKIQDVDFKEESFEKSSDAFEEREKNSKDNKDERQKKDSFFKKGKNRIKSLKEAKNTLDKLPWREWLELGKDIFFRFLKHVLPGKLEGSVAFGLGDPEYTGYITGIAAIFYPKYGGRFSLYPDFERKMFEAKCRGKGKIRPGYLLVLIIDILKEKSIRTMIKNIILG